jgi:agmatinase
VNSRIDDVKQNPLGFLEDKLDGVFFSRKDSRYVVSLVPYEETTTYGKGAAKGPRAIVEASPHMELLDETLHVNASSRGILTLTPKITDLSSIASHSSSVAHEHPGALLCFLGGEHSITPALLEGLGRKDIGIVWIDAHADLRREYRGRPDNHACAGFNSVGFGPIVQIGVRSLSEEEVDFLGRSDRVKCFRPWNEAAKDAIRELPNVVYLSIDMDGFSPTLVRAVGTPEPGGLQWEEVMEILDFVMREKDVFAYDVVELCPQPGDSVSDFVAARLVYKVMNYHTYHKLTGHIPPHR